MTVFNFNKIIVGLEESFSLLIRIAVYIFIKDILISSLIDCNHTKYSVFGFWWRLKLGRFTEKFENKLLFNAFIFFVWVLMMIFESDDPEFILLFMQADFGLAKTA